MNIATQEKYEDIKHCLDIAQHHFPVWKEYLQSNQGLFTKVTGSLYFPGIRLNHGTVRGEFFHALTMQFILKQASIKEADFHLGLSEQDPYKGVQYLAVKIGLVDYLVEMKKQLKKTIDTNDLETKCEKHIKPNLEDKRDKPDKKNEKINNIFECFNYLEKATKPFE
jgi:hypothetical protein